MIESKYSSYLVLEITQVNNSENYPGNIQNYLIFINT